MVCLNAAASASVFALRWTLDSAFCYVVAQKSASIVFCFVACSFVIFAKSRTVLLVVMALIVRSPLIYARHAVVVFVNRAANVVFAGFVAVSVDRLHF